MGKNQINTLKMKKYRVHIRTIYGSLVVDDVEAVDEEEAEVNAWGLAHKELNCGKLDEIEEYEQ